MALHLIEGKSGNTPLQNILFVSILLYTPDFIVNNKVKETRPPQKRWWRERKKCKDMRGVMTGRMVTKVRVQGGYISFL